ncbi:MAG: hypothetical protein L0312_09975, partial [Acidobacteria bacterium]|nr:hypothetical protein [Acidobacteriota bacterium]
VLGGAFGIGLLGVLIYGAVNGSSSSGDPNSFARLAAEFWQDTKNLLILFGYMVISFWVIATAQFALKSRPRIGTPVTLVLLGAFLYGFGKIFWERVFGPILMRNFDPEGLKWFGIILGTALLLGLFVFMSLVVLRKIPSRAKEAVADGVDTVVAFAQATKDQVCPPVTAPPSFREAKKK